MTENYGGPPLAHVFCLAAALACWALPAWATSPPQIFGGRLSHGDCSVVRGRIECRRCDAGWSGIRCNVCRDPSRCGSRPAAVHDGVVTRYFPPGRPNPAWRDGVFAGALEHRTIHQVEPVDNAYERAEDLRRGIENRYGVRRRVTRPLAGDPGHSQADGRVWTRGYRSPGARSLGVVLTGVSLPAGAELWLYSERATHGPVAAGDLPRGVYSTPPLWGDLVYLELRQPPGSGGPPAIDELALIHEYGGAAGPVDCAVDVACFPGAENQANGVALILLHGTFDSIWCSGSLLNTVEGVPIFLTAEHCLWDPSEYSAYLLDPEQANPSGQVDFSSSTFVFHYRNLSCDPPVQDDPTDIWNALSFTGADIELHDHETDIGLLRLDQSPNPACVTYLGFDANAPGAMPGYTAGISHPAGALAQIHVDWDPPTVVDYMDEDPEIEESFVEDDTFYRQAFGAGDHGWPQNGSSGSPLFDPTGRVVGQLSGHWPNNPAVCSGSIGWMSGRLSRSASIVPELGGLLGASQLDAAADTATSAVPLSESKVGPCVNNSYWYTINHRVADGFDVQFELNGDSATIVESAPDGRGVRILFSDDEPVDLRITVASPCYEDERTLRIEPTFCI